MYSVLTYNPALLVELLTRGLSSGFRSSSSYELDHFIRTSSYHYGLCTGRLGVLVCDEERCLKPLHTPREDHPVAARLSVL